MISTLSTSPMKIIDIIVSTITATTTTRRFRRFVIGMFTTMLWAQVMHAQATIGLRATLLDKLNRKLDTLRTGGTSLTVTTSDAGALSLKGLDGGCLTIDDDPIIVLTRDGSNIELKVQLAPAGTMLVPPGTHDLVCDLELAWLKRSWGYTMHQYLAGHALGIDGSNPCYTGGSFAHEFMMWGVGGLDESMPITDSLKQWLAEWSLYTKPYTVVTVESPVEEDQRSGLCTSPRAPSTSFDFNYIARKQNTGGSDFADAKPAYTSVEFHPQTTMTGVVVTKVSIEARVRKYTSDCFPSTYPWMLAPYSDSAFVKITYHVHDLDHGTQSDEYIWRKFATGSVEQDNLDLWNFFDPSVQYLVDGMCNFDIDNQGYLTFTAKPTGGIHQTTMPGTFRIMHLRTDQIPAQECQFTCALSDSFQLDRMTGEIVCRHVGDDGPDSVETVPCLQFCTMLSGYRTMSKVIAASAQRLEYSWPYDTSEFITGKVLGTWPHQNTSNNIYELNQARWRPSEGYAYRTNTKTGGKLASASERVSNNAGVFLNDAGSPNDAFRLFDWRNPDANTGTKWLLASTVTLFSPFGAALEERDIIGVYSAARYSHRNIVPRLVAKNARYTSVGYESFEDGKGSINTTAHSGLWSLRLLSDYPSAGILRLKVTEQMRAKKVLVRLWVRQTYDNYNPAVLPLEIDPAFGSGVLKKIAQTGEWSLYEQVCDVSASDVDDVIDLKLKSNLWPTGHGSPDDEVWVDDVRAQPVDAEMACYAYDAATLRTVAQFDDQHFAAFFQYNGEGKLVRTLRETERGIVTVEERQYHVPDMYNRNGTLASRAELDGGAPPAGTTRRGAGGEHGSEAAGQGTGGRFDLFDMKVGADGVQTKVLGGSLGDLSRFDIDSIRSMFRVDSSRFNPSQLERLGAAGLGDVEKIKDVLAIREIERRIATLEKQKRGELTEAEHREIERVSTELQAERRKLMKERLHVDEEGLRELYRGLEEAESEAMGGKQ